MTAFPPELSLTVDQQIEIAATVEAVFEALLEQLGPAFGATQGASLSLKLEPWPGGRWYRDLGGNQGHFWGHVQVIKPPHLLEIVGPLFMSYPAISHLQLRVTPSKDKTVLTLRHRAIGLIEDEHRRGVSSGWDEFLKAVRSRAQGRR